MASGQTDISLMKHDEAKNKGHGQVSDQEMGIIEEKTDARDGHGDTGSVNEYDEAWLKLLNRLIAMRKAFGDESDEKRLRVSMDRMDCDCDGFISDNDLRRSCRSGTDHTDYVYSLMSDVSAAAAAPIPTRNNPSS